MATALASSDSDTYSNINEQISKISKRENPIYSNVYESDSESDSENDEIDQSDSPKCVSDNEGEAIAQDEVNASESKTEKLPSNTNSPKKTRGRKAVIDYKALRQFCDENTTKFFDSDGTLVRFSAHIIDEAHQTLSKLSKETISKQTVYLAVKRFFQNQTISNQVSNTESDDDTEYVGKSDFEINTTDLKFESQVDCAFLNHTNKSEWDQKLFEMIWEITKVPCNWRFGRHNNSMIEVNIVGACSFKSCHAKILVQTSAERTRLQIYIKNFDSEIKHIGKRRRVHEKTNILDQVRSVGAAAARKNMAAEIMQQGNEEPPHLPTEIALRSQLHKARKENDLHENPVIALRLMKDQPANKETIGDLGLDPFYLFYSLPIQREWVKSQISRNRMEISIDATGLNVSKPKYTSSAKDGKNKPIFLYLVTLHGQKRNLPVYQVLSQRHTYTFIQYFLMTWIWNSLDNRKPDVVNCDDSKALVLACISAFTSCKSQLEYSNRCFRALFHGAEAPECFIRLDRSHMVKSIVKAKWLQNIGSRKKVFFQRVLGYMIQMNNIGEVTNVILNLFKVMLNKFLHNSDVKAAKVFLQKIVDQHILDTSVFPESSSDNNIRPVSELEINNDGMVDTNEGEQESVLDDDDNTDSSFGDWLNSIANNVEENHVLEEGVENTTELEDNLYYSPKLKKAMINVLKKLPFFSNIMCPIYGAKDYSTSSPTEVRFKNIKHSIFKQQKNIRVDRFVQQHIKQLNGEFLLAGAQEKVSVPSTTVVSVPSTAVVAQTAKQPTQTQTKPSTSGTKSKKCDKKTIPQENWRNQNLDLKTSNKKQKRCRKSILNPLTPCAAEIPILKNGSTTGRSKTKIVAENTCAFDVMFQILISACVDIDSFHTKVHNDATKMSELIKTALVGNMRNVYKMRNEMLTFVAKEQTIMIDGLQQVNAMMSINRMFMRICEMCPIYYSLEKQPFCTDCNYVGPNESGTFLQLDLSCLDISNIPNAILESNERDRKKKCLECGGDTMKWMYNYNEVVVLDVEGAATNLENIDFKKEISAEIELNSKKYALKAVVDNCGNHFRANIFRNGWKTYDDMHPEASLKTPKKLNVALIVYTIRTDDEKNQIDTQTANLARKSGELESDTNTQDTFDTNDDGKNFLEERETYTTPSVDATSALATEESMNYTVESSTLASTSDSFHSKSKASDIKSNKKSQNASQDVKPRRMTRSMSRKT